MALSDSERKLGVAKTFTDAILVVRLLEEQYL